MCNTAFLVSGYMTEVDAGLLSVMENVINYDPGKYQAIVLISDDISMLRVKV